MKKVIYLVLLVFLLNGCSRDYPWERSHVWYCAELDLKHTYTEKREGGLTHETSSMVLNGQVYDVEINFSNCCFGIWYDADGDGSLESLVQGNWHYEKGNLVFTDFDDPEFFEPYTQLVFVPQS